MWVLDLRQERVHTTSPGDFDSMFITVRDSEMKEGFRTEKSTVESLGGLLWLFRNFIRKK